MLPSLLSSTTTTTTTTNSTLLSSSPSSSSSSSSSSNNYNYNYNYNNKTKTQKTMEEVWKDITINSLPTNPIHHPSTNSHFKGIIFQDFFNNNNNNGGGGGGGGDDTRNINKSPSSSTSCSQIKPPATTTTEFQFFENEIMMNTTESQQFELQGNSSLPNLISGDTAFDALANSSLLTSFGAVAPSLLNHHHNHKKRLPQGHDNASLVDRRHKRMIKNRESAARSRARKQAYIMELQLEVDSLTKENEMLREQMLRKQQRQLIEAPATQVPTKKGLYRSRSN